MIDQLSASLKVFALQMKPHMMLFVIALCILILILFVIFTLLVIRAKKNHYIQPIHTVKIEETEDKIKKTDGTFESQKDAFALPPFLYGLSEPFEKYLKSGSFAKQFFKAQEFIESSFQDKYALPWFAVLGAEESGKTHIVDSLESYLGTNLPEFEQATPRDFCQFSFFNDAVTLNLNGTFFLDKNDTKSNDNGFRTLLLLLSRYRMKRPLNGIILTISLAEVFGSEAFSKLDLQKRAIVIREKLNALQNYLGVRLPVYVLFTKMDLIPGFQQFLEVLPEQHMHNSIGWSIDIWGKRSIEEGFAGVEKHLQKILTYFLINEDNPEISGNVFAFVNQLMSFNQTLSFYLSQIFLDDFSKTAPMLRGFYYTGILNNQVLFVRDIVQEKIFVEQGVVYPLVSVVSDKRSIFKKTQLGIGVACVVLGAGFWHTKHRFDRQKEAIMPVLHNFVGLSNQLRTARSNEVQKMKYISEETLLNLTQLSEVTSKRFMFFSVFVPATWFSPYRSHLKTTIHKVVQILIVGSLYTYLNQKARNLIDMNLGKLPPSNNIGALIFPTASREFAYIRYYIQEVQKLGENVQKYNYLGGGTSIKEFDDLFQYCFGESLPVDFKDNFHRINKFLGHRDLPKIDLKGSEGNFRKNMALLFQNFHNALFDLTNPKSLVNQLKVLEKTLNPTDSDLLMTIQELHDTSVILSSQIDELGTKKTLWVDASYFDPGIYTGDEFAQVMREVQKNHLFGEQFAHMILLRLNQGFEELKKALRHFNQFIYSDLSTEELDKKHLSDGIFALEKALRFLKSLPISNTSNAQMYASVKPDEIIYCDPFNVSLVHSKIVHALDTKQLPSTLVPKVKIIFEKAVGGFITNTLGHGYIKERMMDETATALEIEGYLRSRKEFIKKFESEWIRILALMKNHDGDFTFFRTQLNKTATYFLTLIDQLAEMDTLYRPKGFANWDGKGRATGKAFDATDKAAVEKYLDIQLARMKFLKELAEPLVTFLNSDVMDSEFNDKELVVKWEKIAHAIDQKTKGQNAGYLTDLEDFVKKDMNELTPDKAYENFDKKDLDLNSIDFFKRRLGMIKSSILGRSEELLRGESIEKYNTLRQFFLKHLQGKFPFSTTREREVSLSDIKKFFELYDKVGGAPEKILRKIEGLENVDHATKWVNAMHQLRQLFATFLEDKVNAPEVQIEWDFRVDRDREINGDHVMDFTFKPGSEKEMVFISKEKKYSRWVFGDKIEVGFEWSKGDNKKNSPLPVSDSIQPQLIVNGKKALFVYTDPWALFTVLRMHRTKRNVLKFEVPQDNGDKFIGYNKMRFTKEGLTPKDPKEYIDLPDLPTQAPELLIDAGVIQHYETNQPREETVPIMRDHEDPKKTVNVQEDDHE